MHQALDAYCLVHPHLLDIVWEGLHELGDHPGIIEIRHLVVVM